MKDMQGFWVTTFTELQKSVQITGDVFTLALAIGEGIRPTGERLHLVKILTNVLLASVTFLQKNCLSMSITTISCTHVTVPMRMKTTERWTMTPMMSSYRRKNLSSFLAALMKVNRSLKALRLCIFLV